MAAPPLVLLLVIVGVVPSRRTGFPVADFAPSFPFFCRLEISRLIFIPPDFCKLFGCFLTDGADLLTDDGERLTLDSGLCTEVGTFLALIVFFLCNSVVRVGDRIGNGRGAGFESFDFGDRERDRLEFLDFGDDLITLVKLPDLKGICDCELRRDSDRSLVFFPLPRLPERFLLGGLRDCRRPCTLLFVAGLTEIDLRRCLAKIGKGSVLIFPETGETLSAFEVADNILNLELDLEFAICFAISIREFGRELARDAARDIGCVDARDVDREPSLEFTREAVNDASVLIVAREVVRLDVAREVGSDIGSCATNSLSGDDDREPGRELEARIGIFERDSLRAFISDGVSEGANKLETSFSGLCGELLSLFGVPIIGERVVGLTTFARDMRPPLELAGGIEDCRRFVCGLEDGNRDFRRCI